LIAGVLGASMLKGWRGATSRHRVRHLVLSPNVRQLLGDRATRFIRRARRPKSAWAGARLTAIAGAGLFDRRPVARPPCTERSSLCDLMSDANYAEAKESNAQFELKGGCSRVA